MKIKIINYPNSEAWFYDLLSKPESFQKEVDGEEIQDVEAATLAAHEYYQICSAPGLPAGRYISFFDAQEATLCFYPLAEKIKVSFYTPQYDSKGITASGESDNLWFLRKSKELKTRVGHLISVPDYDGSSVEVTEDQLKEIRKLYLEAFKKTIGFSVLSLNNRATNVFEDERGLFADVNCTRRLTPFEYSSLPMERTMYGPKPPFATPKYR